MIAQLKGILIYKSANEAIIDCHGVGYSLSISLTTSSALPETGNETRLFTLMVTREDSVTLFGFAEPDEREAFKLLNSVSGVGPKTAIGMLSFMNVSDLQQNILVGNITALQKMPGIGKKTAERIHLELKDKITKLGIALTKDSSRLSELARQEAVSALSALGFSAGISEKAVKTAIENFAGEDINAEKIIRSALKIASNM